jgi:hypothetical protein
MESLEEKTTNFDRLLKASREGDEAAVRELLENGNVDANGANEVRLLPVLRRTARDLQSLVLRGNCGHMTFAGRGVPCEDRPKSQRS